MEINIKINVGENPPVDLISRLFSTAIALDTPLTMRKVQVDGISLTEYPAQTETKTQTLFQAVAQDSYHVMAENAEQAEQAGEGDADEAGTSEQPAVGGAPAKKKAGRKSNAQKAAEAAEAAQKAAAEAAAATMVAGAKASVAPVAETPAITLPPGAGGNVTSIAPGGFTLPPGVTMLQQPAQQPVQQVQPPTHVPAAMPTVPPGAQPTGDVVPFEDFRGIYQGANTRFPGKPFAILKATTWRDGTPKQGWFTAEAVPPEFRVRLIEEWSMLT